MKILVVGASGTLGRAVVKELSAHELVTASRSSGDIRVDMRDAGSIRAMFEAAGRLDAVVCTAGKTSFSPLAEMSEEKMKVGIGDKLMGQVNLVLEGTRHLNDGGSFTLISGVLGYDFIRTGTNASLVNGALQSFVRAAAIELPRGIRINSVSPTVFVESMEHYGPFFPGFKPVPVADAALAYRKSVEGLQTGQVYCM
ncbi:MAG: short chain dehydrogenase [Rhizobiaceae bacterium]|nr:short chain dehydrogenase [Rhizobiaceae bacterium]